MGGTQKKKRKKPFTKVSAPETAQHHSRLLSLPAELRLLIYSLALPDTVAYTARKTKKCPRLHLIKPTPPGLILACRQTHAEAIQILYKQADFTFDRIDHLKKWTTKIGQQRRDLIQYVRVHSPAPSIKVMFGAYWEPHSALTMFAMEAEKALRLAKEVVPDVKDLLKTDVYMPGRFVEVVWTEKPIEVVNVHLEKHVDERSLSRETYQALSMLVNDRAKMW